MLIWMVVIVLPLHSCGMRIVERLARKIDDREDSSAGVRGRRLKREEGEGDDDDDEEEGLLLLLLPS